jgi:hypothetical protein
VIAPNGPRFFALNGQGLNATESSDLTDSSDSTDNLDPNAARASADLTRLSAQAACARTNGSGSESAEISTGTASGAPQFPIATATFRRNPTYPARRIADPRVHTSQSS